ncbi:hypothetical protein ACH3VR_02765 [Microbacterium sp. B2969]|uniref:Major facilitator superfamily (MFS) profile domain-containing protein n=1 Tax=Microbacterium alkaliflavum TaxID=3248839 RepID=A0ABW7Q372_9MICO
MGVVEGWSEFNVAMMGATAALAGLVIVAASVNIREIIDAPSVAARLASAIAGLVLAIVGSAVGLIPGITALGYGVMMIVFGVVTALFSTQATRRIYENHHPANRLKLAKSVVGFVAPLGYVAGGILLVAGVDAGVFWFAAGAIAAIVAAVLISWIALVEVLR